MTSSQPSQGRNARKESSRGLVGTVPFLAPEIARPGAKHTQASDVYSFALFLYELAYPSKPHPWHGVCDIPELIVSTAEKGLRPPLSELNIEGGQSGSFLHLITQCWKASASERPNMSEISTSLKEIACSDTSDLEGQSSPTTTPINADVDTDAVDENIISVLPLSYHQNKVIEDASEVLAQGFAANGGVLDQELVQDLEKNASALDGTNSCSFLTMKIIDNLYTTNSEAFRNATTLKNTIEKIITTFPTEVNRLRDISKHFSVDEAYEILHAQQLLLRRYNFKESLSTSLVGQSAEGVTELEVALRHMANKSSNAFAVYTCPPIIFTIVHTVDDDCNRFYVIDTHKVSYAVGGNGNGVITSASYRGQQLSNVTNALARWVRKRIASSVSQPAPQSLLEVDLQREVVQIDVSDGEDDLLAVLDDFEKSQNTQGATKTDEGQTNSQADYIHPSSLLPPTDSEVILWKGHLTNFGLATFREFQIEAINAIEKGNDVVVRQRTGSGKSLVYQVPSLFSSVKYTIVISPTISLILSQVNHLKEKGVDAIPFGSPAGQEKEKHFARLNKMEERKPSLVYMTPECFATNMAFFTEHKNEIKMILLDEAHKIFDRNSEFRKCYDCLKDIPATFVDIPVIALTATIDSQSLSKLCSVYLRHPVVIKGTVDRPNIKMPLGQYKLVTEQRKSKAKNTDGSSCKSNARPWKDVAQEICSMVGHNYAIVYVDFKNDVEKLVETLKECGVEDVKRYHGRDISDIKSGD